MFGLNPWVILGGVLFFFASVTGSFFYGSHVGKAELKAEQLDTVSGQFAKYAEQAGKNAKQGTADALKDFQARLSVVDNLANSLKQAQGTMDNAASKLSASLKNGSCKLAPAQRRLLECIRRPSDPICHASPS